MRYVIAISLFTIPLFSQATINGIPNQSTVGGTATTITGAIVEANTPLTTKGDLLVEDGTTLHRLAVGTNNAILWPDSTATDGLAYSPYVMPPTIAAHQIPVAISPTSVLAKTIPDCVDTGGNHLNFTQSTDLFSCGTSGSGGTGYLYTAVTFSATPTFTYGAGAALAINTFKITLTGNVTSSTVAAATAGQQANFIICQDATGSRTFAWPTGFHGTMTIGSTLSTCSSQNFTYDGSAYYASAAGVINQ